MGARARGGTHEARVTATRVLSEHLVAVEVAGAMADGWRTSGVGDEWVPIAVAGLPETRFYTVRDLDPDADRLRFDVVVHAAGLVTEWAQSDPVGEPVLVGLPQASYAPPAGTTSLALAGDLTALPAIARLLETVELPARAWVESADGPLRDYVRPDVADAVTWVAAPAPPAGRQAASAIAETVEAWDALPPGTYVWTAGESGQMRRIRRHLRLDRHLPSRTCNVWGYWRG